MEKRERLNLFYSREISGGGNAGTKRFLRSFFVKILGSAGKAVSYTSTKSYGAFSLSFGVLTLLLNFGGYYFAKNPSIEPTHLIIGAIFALIGIPLIFLDRPLCIAVQDFALTDYLFFEFFSVKRMHRLKNPPSIPILLAIFMGFIPAILGFVFPLKYVLMGIGALAVFSISFVSPEFPLILTLLALPYIRFIPYSEYIFTAMSVLSFLSFAIRVLIGKRIYHMDIYSALIFLFGAFMALGGFMGYADASSKSTWIYLALLLSYFPASSLIVNRRLADAAIKSIVFSSLPVSIFVVIRAVVSIIKGGFNSLFPIYYGDSFGGEESFLLGAYLLVSAIFTLMFSLQKKEAAKKTFYAIFCALNLLGIVFSSQLGAAISTVLCVLLAIFIFSKRISSHLIFPVALLPYFIPFIPNAYLDKVSQVLRIAPNISNTVGKLVENVSVFFANILIGVGIGDESYDVYVGVSGERVDNLLIGIGTSVGIFALLIFFGSLVIKFFHTAVYSSYVRHSSVNIVNGMCTIVLSALIMYGAFGNIFKYAELFYLFFVIFGITSATLRDAKKEYDDRIGYYDDGRSSESSAIDINVL